MARLFGTPGALDEQNIAGTAKEDLKKRQKILDTSGVPGVLSEAAQELYNNPAVNTAIGLTPIVGDVQSGAEAIRSLSQGNIGEGLLNAAGVLPFVPALAGRTVWHGSPHSFDAFDLSKAGSGNGASAFGEGVNLTENKKIASGYGENLYKVDLPDEVISKMLDFRIPFKDQPKVVQDAFLKYDPSMINQPELHDEYFKYWLATPGTSKKLQELGITGIKRVTRGVDESGNPLHNYVVFDDKKPKIVGKE